jgi:hypothetical protein
MRRDILATREELASLRERIGRRPFDTIYDVLRKRCSLILETPPVSEQQWRMSWQQGVWGSALSAARTTQGRIMDLVIAHRIDSNAAYRNRAVEELKNLVGWSTWVDPCYGDLAVDLCTAEAGVAATVGLDWLWEDLGEADRLRVLHAIRNRVILPYRQSVTKGAWWYNCYHHWNAVINSGCGLAALALSDEEHAAHDAYQMARGGLKRFFDALGREGGWDEGTGYWGYALRYVLLLGEASSRAIDDQSVFHSRGMDATGLFPIYFTPNGQPASFGDSPAVPSYGAFYILVKRYGLKEVTWWLDTYGFHRDTSPSGWSAAGLALLYRPIDAEVPAGPDLMPLKVFHQIGWAAMADRWPRPAFYVAAKTGDLSANHSQRDMNSLQLQVDGEMLLVDLGHAPLNREYLSDARKDVYEVQARAHNTITVAERDHCIDAQGTVVEAQVGKDFRWLACDAEDACGENTHFVRHLVMLVNPKTQAAGTLVVLDELHNGTPERMDVYWHTLGRLELNAETMSGRITGQGAGICFTVASTFKLLAMGQERPSGGRQTEQILHLTGGLVGRGLIATIFSRRPVTGKVHLKQTTTGARVQAGGIDLHFKRLKRHLQLADVKQSKQ